MNKILNWLKKRTYIILLIVCGIGYFTYSDNWQVYAEPLKEAEGWCREKWIQLGGQVTDVSATEEGNENGQSTSGEEIVTAGDGVQSDGSVTGDSYVTDNGSAANDGSSGYDGDSVEEGNSVHNDSTVEEDSPANDGSTAGNDSIWGSEDMQSDNGAGAGNGMQAVSYKTVEDDYFADAVFIGDSRTVGMYEYGGLEEISTFYASTGLTVYKMFDSPLIKVPGQRKKQTVEEALQKNSFAKIYLMIGINEMGTGTVETFIAKYKEAVEHLRELQPDAVIYLQGIMKVTTERSEQGDYITNEGIEARNEEIAKLADNDHVFYLDVNPLICDETGGMEPSYTFDGVHLKAQYIPIWKDYLKEHAVDI